MPHMLGIPMLSCNQQSVTINRIFRVLHNFYIDESIIFVRPFSLTAYSLDTNILEIIVRYINC